MKICLINNLYKPYNRGGAERVVETTAAELEKTGHEVLVISARPVKRKTLNAKKCRMFYPWNIISYYNLHKLPKLIRPLWHLINIFNPQSYFKVKNILKHEKPDLVMTHNLMGVGFLTPRAIKKRGIRHAHTLHDIQLIHPSGLLMHGRERMLERVHARAYSWVSKKLFSTVDVVVSPSEWLMKMHADRGFFQNSKKIVMANPVRQIACPESKLFAGQTGKPFIFLYVGQIEKHKGVELLREAFGRLTDARLWIAGEGKESKKLKIKSKNLGLDNIKFLGRKNSAEVQKLMQEADCLVLPSLCYENQPTVIIEARENNLPVLASNIGGVPEMLEEKFLFKAGDREELTKKMKWVIEHRDELQITDAHRGMSAREYIEKLMKL